MLLVLLVFCSSIAHAEVDNSGLLDNVLDRYAAVASTWATTITERASWLFWTLALISMVWTFGMMVMRKADLGEFYAEFVRFTIFTGFFWWMLINGPQFAVSIMNSLRQVGAQATGLGSNLAPSGIVDIGFDIFMKVVESSSVWDLDDSICGILIATAILVVFALVGVNMLLLLISSWILAYAGVFFLGFGGSRWTSEMAIGYFRTVLNVAGQLFGMVLLVGIGKSFIDQYYAAMSGGIRLKELGSMLVVAAIMLALVKTVPGLIGGLAGGNSGSLGSGFGAGAAVGAATMAGAAISTGGAALVGAAAGAAGGAQALMAAFSKALASESGGGAKDLMSAAGGVGESSGDTSNTSGASLATAMGDGGGGASSSASAAGTADATGVNESSSPSAGGQSSAEGTASAKPSETKSQSANTTSGTRLGGPSATPSKSARVAGATIANLAAGAWEVAKSKGANLREAAAERVASTTGGKIAAAINAGAAERTKTASSFDGDSLSAGKQQVDAESEIAAFRNRDRDGDDDKD